MPANRTSPGSKLLSLEIARFLAALAVALEHLSTTIPNLKLGPAPLPPMPASAAVLFFFTLSGFVIYNAHAADFGRPNRLPRYAWRRIWRIFPLYWLSLLPMLAVLWPGCTAGYLARIFTLYPLNGPIAELNPPAWTLRYELLFYIIFGLALLPVARRVLLPAWGLLLAAVWFHVFRGWGGPSTLLPALPLGVSQHVLALDNIMFFGGLGAGWVFAHWRPAPRMLWPLFACSVLALAWLLMLDGWGTSYPATGRMPFTALAFAAVIFGLAALERSGQLRLHPGWAALGAMSYPLYLLHSGASFVFSAFFFFHPTTTVDFPPRLTFCAMLLLALAASWLAARFFDAPLQRLARRVM